MKDVITFLWTNISVRALWWQLLSGLRAVLMLRVGTLGRLLCGKAEIELAAPSELWKWFCAISGSFLKSAISQSRPPQLFLSAVRRGRPASWFRAEQHCSCSRQGLIWCDLMLQHFNTARTASCFPYCPSHINDINPSLHVATSFLSWVCTSWSSLLPSQLPRMSLPPACLPKSWALVSSSGTRIGLKFVQINNEIQLTVNPYLQPSRAFFSL